MRSSWFFATALFCILGSSCLVVQDSLAQLTTLVTQATDVPRTMSYQGYLSGTDGRALRDGQYAINVRLYSDPDGIRSIYEATYQATIVNGLFNIMLGSGSTPLPSTEKMNAPLWIGITVNGHEELKPYTPLSASPYALNVPNSAITSDKLQDGSVTARKMGTDYVGSFWLDGDQITGRGGKINLEGANGINIQFDLARNTLVFRGSGSTANASVAPIPGVTPGTLNDLIVNGNVDLGGISPNSQIKFKGRAATSLNMNSNSITDVGELLLGHGKSYDGRLSLYSSSSVGHASIIGGPQLFDHTYTIPDAGFNAEFVLSQGAQSISGTKKFVDPIVGSLNGNALTASNAAHATSSDLISNSWVAGASIVAALITNGGTIANSTTGNAKTATLASSALSARTAEQADQIATTYSAGSSIDRALKAYSKPISTDITGTASHALQANDALHALAADHAVEMQTTWAAGYSVANALKAWNGTIANNTLGNAATVTNGLYSTGRYTDPLWLPTLSGSKITGPVNSAVNATNAAHATLADHATSANTSDKAAIAITVVDGVYTTGSYSDPKWITSLSASKLVGSVPVAQFAESARIAAPIGAAGGDLAGNFPSPEVIRVGLNAGSSIVDAINHSTSTISAVSIAKNLSISGGSINATPIGSSIPSTGSFTTAQSTASLGASSAPQLGTRYSDNNIVAWGDISSDGTIISQFGGMTIEHPEPGMYKLTLPSIPQAAAVQVTSQNAGPVLFSAQRLGNVITVHAYNLSPRMPVAPIEGAFYVVVVARP